MTLQKQIADLLLVQFEKDTSYMVVNALCESGWGRKTFYK